MPDYEIVELKLAVAREEGCAARGGEREGLRTLQIEGIMPGLSVLATPTHYGTLYFAVLTDHEDLSLLGFKGGGQAVALLIHAADVECLGNHGVQLRLNGAQTRASLPGWYFFPFPWDSPCEMQSALGEILPPDTLLP